MSHDEISPERFAAAFAGFLEAFPRSLPSPGPVLIDRLRTHLGNDATSLPVITETFDAFEHPNVQVALDDYVTRVDPGGTYVGIAGEQKQYVTSVLSMIVGQGDMPGMRPVGEGPVDYVNFRLAAERVLPCVQHGLLLLDDGAGPLVAAVLGPSTMHGPRQQVQVEVLATDPERGQAFLKTLRERMDRLNVYRGHVLSLDPGRLDMGAQTLVSFHDLPEITRDDVVLPGELLERVERHTIVFSRHADALGAAGRSLKRGMLLYGAPGTGKTLTLMYLIGQMPDRTVLLMSGGILGLLKPAMQMARTLAPAMVVLEDVDLIAEERGNPFAPSGGLLFELLNELDGLNSDADVIFALTTNRPEALESALAARPGRVDLAVEFPLPSLAHRRRLLDLYARGLTLVDVDLDEIAAGIDGASPAYIKELLRRAAVLSAEDDGPFEVTQSHLTRARDELSGGGALGRRILGFQSGRDEETAIMPGFPTGFFPPQ